MRRADVVLDYDQCPLYERHCNNSQWTTSAAAIITATIKQFPRVPLSFILKVLSVTRTLFGLWTKLIISVVVFVVGTE